MGIPARLDPSPEGGKGEDKERQEGQNIREDKERKEEEVTLHFILEVGSELSLPA